MAVWADFDDDDEPSDHSLTDQPQADQSHDYTGPKAYISHALRCYPVSERLASYLDLTDLNSLSSTCRPVHESLVQFAPQLKQNSLRCIFEIEDEEQEQKDAILALHLSLEDHLDLPGNGPAFPVSIYSEAPSHFQSGLGLSGKVSKCARDLVAPCRRCGTIVCRNCIEKPPSNKMLPGRLRRLCDTCIEAPLILHKGTLREPVESVILASSDSSIRSDQSDSNASDQGDPDYHQTARMLSQLPEMWLRNPCDCEIRGVYLCHQCGHKNYATDNIYQRVWRWRSRYSTHLGGGLGTGLGQGDQGQKCGRDKFCLATRDAMALVEADCSADDASTPNTHELSRSNTPVTHDHEHEARMDPGYFRQEIEGVGGKVKSKSKKLVKVGATVYEFRDERETGKYLAREKNGDLRAWCSWCSRVCPGRQDREDIARLAHQA